MAKILHPSTGKPIEPKDGNGKDPMLKHVQTVFEDLRCYVIAMAQEEKMPPEAIIAGLSASLDFFKNALREPDKNENGDGKPAKNAKT